MEFDQSKAISSLLKKLSALRVTLATEERAVLDALVTRSISAPDEIAAHRMTTAVSPGAVAGAISPAKSMEQDEMVGHAMDDAVSKQTVPIAQPRTTPVQIIYDEKTKAYKIF